MSFSVFSVASFTQHYGSGVYKIFYPLTFILLLVFQYGIQFLDSFVYSAFHVGCLNVMAALNIHGVHLLFIEIAILLDIQLKPES